MKRLCKRIAAPSVIACLLVVLGVAGAIEHGASLSRAWIAFGAIGLTYLVLCVAARDRS